MVSRDEISGIATEEERSETISYDKSSVTPYSDGGVVAFMGLDDDAPVDLVGAAVLDEEEVDTFEVIEELTEQALTFQVLTEQALNPELTVG